MGIFFFLKPVYFSSFSHTFTSRIYYNLSQASPRHSEPESRFISSHNTTEQKIRQALDAVTGVYVPFRVYKDNREYIPIAAARGLVSLLVIRS
jgi:hypothetical protein